MAKLELGKAALNFKSDVLRILNRCGAITKDELRLELVTAVASHPTQLTHDLGHVHHLDTETVATWCTKQLIEDQLVECVLEGEGYVRKVLFQIPILQRLALEG